MYIQTQTHIYTNIHTKYKCTYVHIDAHTYMYTHTHRQHTIRHLAEFSSQNIYFQVFKANNRTNFYSCIANVVSLRSCQENSTLHSFACPKILLFNTRVQRHIVKQPLQCTSMGLTYNVCMCPMRLQSPEKEKKEKLLTTASTKH